MEQRLLEDFAHIASDWFWEMDEDLRFTYFSERIKVVSGTDPAGAVGKSRLEIAANSADPSFWQPHIQDLLSRRPFRDFDYPYQRANGQTLWFRISGQPYFDPNGAFLGYRGVGTDITGARTAQLALDRALGDLQAAHARQAEHNEALYRMNSNLKHEIASRERLEAELRRLAVTDSLTGLANRIWFGEQFKLALDGLSGSGNQVAVLYLDLDHFKAVNDTLGHSAGDVLLRQVAARLQKLMRASDCLARIGGDEFIILQRETNQPVGAGALAARAVEALCAPFDLDGSFARIGASVGVAIYPEDGGNTGELLRKADMALYRAKAQGRGTFCFYEHKMGSTPKMQRDPPWVLERQVTVVDPPRGSVRALGEAEKRTQ